MNVSELTFDMQDDSEHFVDLIPISEMVKPTTKKDSGDQQAEQKSVEETINSSLEKSNKKLLQT